MAAPAYSSVGPYRTGVWLVELKDGAAAIMNRQNLPAYTPGTKYYWLGGDPNKAAARLPGALQALNLDVGTYPTAQGLNPAFSGTRVLLRGDWNAPGGPGPAAGTAPTGKPVPSYPGATFNQGPLGGISSAINSTEDFLKMMAWIFHPLNWLRAAEFLIGIVTMLYGISILVRGMRHSRMTHRTSISSTITGLFAKSPAGRAVAVSAQRRAGRRQGERDVAYQTARRRARAPGQTQREGSAQTYTPRPTPDE